MQSSSETAPPPLAAPLESTKEESDGIQRGFIATVVSASHLMNHLQGGVGAVLLPIMMKEMGFGYFELGMLTSMYQLSSTAMQAVYGLLAQYYRRSMLLGVANIIVGVFAAAMGLTQTYAQVMGVRLMAGGGASAQHPLGATILSSYFRKTKGRMLGIHHTAGNVGSLVAPLIVVVLLRFLDWRTIWVVLAIPSVLMGFAYFFFRDSISGSEGSKKSRAKMSLRYYLDCLRNREVMVVSAIQMAGAAGRGTDINQAFFVPFFMAAMGVDTAVAALLLALMQFGGVLGPVSMGWLSDHVGRKITIFIVLFLSTVSTITLLFHSQVSAALLLNLLVYGIVVNSRESLTQSMVSDAVPDTHADAAFSLYYFIGFISGPAWSALTGYLIDRSGFGLAFVVVGLTYLNGIWLIGLLSPKKKVAGATH